MDLHIHTCLSPCGDNGMVPPVIVERALAAGLQGIAVCDHNAAANIPAIREAGAEAGLSVIPGMEVTTAEEIHLLALFDGEMGIGAFADLVGSRLPGTNDPDAFGDQIVVDSRGEPVALEERLLIGATDLGIRRIVEEIHGLGGLAIASHVDKPVFSLISQLGFIPPELGLDAVELSRHAGEVHRYPLGDLPVVRSSDAHFPEEIGRAVTAFLVAEATVAEIRLALRRERGRRVV
jgi:predicted metal-dependent phosphoesterase TrpH